MSHTTPRSGRMVLRPIPPVPAVGFPLPPCAPPVGAGVTLERWLELWMERDIEPFRADTTVSGYSSIIRKHIVPALGRVRLSDLSPQLVNGYYQWLSDEKGLSPNTIRKHHILLHTALKSAFRQGVVPLNPIQRATPPRPTEPEAVYYTPARLARLLQAVDGTSLEVPVRLACFLGLRRGELLGLRWRDVDLQSGQLSVRTQRRQEGLPCSPDDFLLLGMDGRPIRPSALSSSLAAFVREHRLPPITFHGLRHTFASMANSARVPMYQISRAMGHASPGITQRIYTHLFDQTHGEVLAAVANVVKADSTSLTSA